MREPIKEPDLTQYMNIAIAEAKRGMRRGDGGPFGTVIVKDGKVIAKAHNMVLATKDPTMHAEIVAIRKACKKTGSFDLSGCRLVSTCEPCPMCMAAIYWAKIRHVVFGCTRSDAAKINFADREIYDVFDGAVQNPIKCVRRKRQACLCLFKDWAKMKEKTTY